MTKYGIKTCINNLEKKKYCPTMTPAGKVPAGVQVCFASPEPIEF